MTGICCCIAFRSQRLSGEFGSVPMTRSKAAWQSWASWLAGSVDGICTEADLSTLQTFQFLFIETLNSIGIRIIWCGEGTLLDSGYLTGGSRSRCSRIGVAVPAATVIWVGFALYLCWREPCSMATRTGFGGSDWQTSANPDCRMRSSALGNSSDR